MMHLAELQAEKTGSAMALGVMRVLPFGHPVQQFPLLAP